MISENIGKEKNSVSLGSACEWCLSRGLPEDVSASIWEEPARGWCQNQRKERREGEKLPVILSESLDPAEPETTSSSKLLGSFPQSVSQFSRSVCPTLCDPMNHSTPGSLSITNFWSLPKLTSIESVMPSNHLILCRPLLLLPSIFPSIRAFSNESVLRIRWPKYWSFSFNTSPSNEHSGLISFRMDWLDLLAVQGTLKSLLQHHGSKATETLITCRVSHLILLQSLQCCGNFFPSLFSPYSATV